MNGNSPFILPINLSLLAASVLCLMPVILVVLKMHRDLKERRARNKSPFKELKRRPAGESLRIKIGELDEQINDRLFFFLGMPIGLAVAMFVVKSLNLFGAFLIVLLSLIWTLAL